MFRSIAILPINEQLSSLKKRSEELDYDQTSMVAIITELIGVVCNLHNEGYLLINSGDSDLPVEERIMLAIYRHVVNLGLDKSILPELMALSSRVCIELKAIKLDNDTRAFRVDKLTDSFAEISYETS